MPLFDFECPDCRYTIVNKICSSNEILKLTCPCGGKMKKKLPVFNIQINGASAKNGYNSELKKTNKEEKNGQ